MTGRLVIVGGAPGLIVDTTDGYTPALEHVATFARGATVRAQ